ncbi:PE-PGRS family protein PE_PGRS5-like [Anopheles moucheti]|uniref:PE-PGRS family protein PE_PGRS5-like n=1 Tax=Anopheles moucheti TaxID=186751 RepID=UPI0022F0E07C|nr:PE-PGRS family protein PE_PGRS5-like [Anopheles moucheti]
MAQGPTLTWMVLSLMLGVITEQGYGWNLQPNTYYQGAGSGGYFGGRGPGSLSNQAGAGASGGSWSAGGGGFQGQTGGGASGGVDRAVGNGANQWTGGDSSRALGGVAGGVSTASDSFGADGTGFQQSGGAPLATGSEGGASYNNQGNSGNFGPANGQFAPHHANGPVTGANALAGSFASSGSGFGAGGHYHGSRPTTSTYGAQPWRYGAPHYGAYGAARWPWHGNGYVYRVPVAHINPDGSYSFSYYTPHFSREETGHSNGNVEGSYGFQTDGAKHNFSFDAAPDVDLRTSIGDSRVGVANPAEYGPQSVHSRARLPLVPQTTFQPGVDEETRTSDGAPNSWASRSGVDAGANDQSSLAVVGLPRASTEATDTAQPTATDRNQIVRGSTESVGVSDLEARLSQADGTVTAVPPLGGSVEQVVTRPENEVPSYGNEIGQNDLLYNGVANGGYQPFGAGTSNVARDGTVSPDRSYRFGYQTPDAAREETADQAGNVRGSFSYNNEAGRNDMQYVAGAGMGFRPTGGSLSVPNGLAGGGGATGTGLFGGSGSGFGDSGGVGNQGVGGAFGGSGVGFGDNGVVGNQGVGGAFGGSDTSLGGSGVGNRGGQGVGGTFGGSGSDFGDSSGIAGNQGGQAVGGAFGGSGTGVGGAGVFGNQGGQRVGGNFGGSGFGAGGQAGSGVGGNFGGSTAGFGADGRSRAFGNQGTQTGLGAGTQGAAFGSDGRPLAFGNQGSQLAGGAAGTFGGSNTGFGADGRPLASGNQGAQSGSGARGTFGGFDGRFGSQSGQGFGSFGNQGTTHNPITRSTSANGFNGGQWNGSTSRSVSVSEDDNTTINDEDTEQTTTFGDYGDATGGGLFTNANRRLAQ